MDIYSGFVLSQVDKRPMYLQIMEQIKQRVACGDWREGEKIPSIRELAVGIRVSVITVKRAYQELEREGVIVTQPGKGSFIAINEKLGARIYEAELNKDLENVIKLSILLGIDENDLLMRVRKNYEKLKRKDHDK